MIDYPRSENLPATALKVRLLGIGNAGVHLADRLTMSGASGVDIIAINTDGQSLTHSVVEQKISLGQKVTRGLGTGGDPEVGYEAAQESLSDIRAATEGAGLVFLCAGLGGGTGSGVIPLVAESAKENGAIVFAIVTSPFTFEGRWRSSQAAEALTSLAEHCHAVIHFENDRMAELASPRSGVEETFAASDNCLGACVTSLLEILQGGNPMPVGLADLLAAVGGGSAHAVFGRGEAFGENRAHEALERALKSPLLDRGRLMAEAHAAIVHVSGPASLSFAEVAAVMRELGKQTADAAKLFLGVTTQPDPSAPVVVTVIGNYSATGEPPAPLRRVERPKPEAAKPAPRVKPAAAEPVAASAEEPPPLFETPQDDTPPEERPNLADRIPARASQTAPKPQPAAPPPPKVKQETLQFDAVARGRFEKSEPTIVEGEDLDVPTFLRMRGKPPGK